MSKAVLELMIILSIALDLTVEDNENLIGPLNSQCHFPSVMVVTNSSFSMNTVVTIVSYIQQYYRLLQ